MPTENISHHWIVEFGWLTSTAFVAVTMLNWLSIVIITPVVPRPLRTAAGAELPDRSRPALDAARLAPLLDLPTPVEPPARDVSSPREPASVVTDNTPWIRVREIESTYEVWESPSTHLGTSCPPVDARVVPVFREGRAVGFALVRIRPGSWYAKLGLVDGDIIRRVNGFEMSPERVLGADERLKDAETIVLDLERGGAALRKTYVRRVGEPPNPSPRPR